MSKAVGWPDSYLCEARGAHCPKFSRNLQVLFRSVCNKTAQAASPKPPTSIPFKVVPCGVRQPKLVLAGNPQDPGVIDALRLIFICSVT